MVRGAELAALQLIKWCCRRPYAPRALSLFTPTGLPAPTQPGPIDHTVISRPPPPCECHGALIQSCVEVVQVTVTGVMRDCDWICHATTTLP